MKQIVILFFLPIISFGQSIYSKDNINLGDRDDFITTCVKSGNNVININGVDIQMTSYCSCVCDKLMPELFSWEMEEAVENNALIELFTEDKNLKILLDCGTTNVQVGDDYNFGYKSFEEYSEAEILIGIKSCVFEAEKNYELQGLFTANEIYLYCSCAIERLIREGHTMGQLNKIDDAFADLENFDL